MRPIIFALFLFLAPTSASNSASLYKAQDDGSLHSIINTEEQLEAEFEPPIKYQDYMRGRASSCNVKGIKTKCFAYDGYFISTDPIPVLPSRLFFDINGGSKSKNKFYDATKFTERARNLGSVSLELLNPIEHYWANGEVIVWMDAGISPLASELGKMWTGLAAHSKTKPIDRNGRIMISVSHRGRITKSLQVCWMFFDKIDPEAGKCTTVMVERDGKSYVRFIHGYYDGGYSLEPENVFGCNVVFASGEGKVGIKQLLAELTKKFANGPFKLVVSSEKIGRDAGVLRLIRKYEPSDLFPEHREIIDMRFIVDRDGEKIQPDGQKWEPRDRPNYYEIELLYSFAISKQNVGELPDMINPSEEQTEYFNKAVIKFMEENLPCRKGA